MQFGLGVKLSECGALDCWGGCGGREDVVFSPAISHLSTQFLTGRVERLELYEYFQVFEV